jgi:hypothetical protein
VKPVSGGAISLVTGKRTRKKAITLEIGWRKPPKNSGLG